MGRYNNGGLSLVYGPTEKHLPNVILSGFLKKLLTAESQYNGRQEKKGGQEREGEKREKGREDKRTSNDCPRSHFGISDKCGREEIRRCAVRNQRMGGEKQKKRGKE